MNSLTSSPCETRVESATGSKQEQAQCFNVLVVEDRPDSGCSIAESLSETYAVSQAPDGPSAISRATVIHPDAIVLDLDRAHLDATAFLDQLRAHQVIRHIPVIVVSAKAQELASSLLRDGVSDCLPRAIEPDQLKARIERILKLQSSFRQVERSERRYRELFDSIDEGFTIIKVLFNASNSAVDYEFLEVNAAFVKQTGMVDAVGRRMREFAAEHEEHWFATYGDVARTGQPVRFEACAKQLGRWYSVYAFRVGDARDNQVAVLFKDITSRKKAEFDLLETKARLATAMRVGRMSAWAVDVPNMQVRWARDTAAIFGLGDDVELDTRAVWKSITPPDRRRLRQAVLRSVACGDPFDLEVLAAAPAGNKLHLRVIGEAVLNAEGITTCVHGAMQDVTELKAAKQRAQDLGETLAITLERVSDSFFTVDRDWRFTYVNGRAEALLRRSREHLIGKVLWDEYPDGVGTLFQREYERALAQFSTTEFEAYFAPYDVWLRVTAHPSDDGLAVYLRDVTEDRKATEALAERETEYRMLFENCMDGILQTATDGRIIRANPAACAMLKMSQAEICRAGRNGLVAPDDARLLPLLADRKRTGRTRGELTLLRGDGSRFEAEVSSATYETFSGKVRSFMMLRDITERLEAQKEVLALTTDLARRVSLRTAELEQANAELNEFAHSLAHDLRSPVAAINGFSQMLERSLPTLLPERSLHYLGRIHEAARRMDEYIEGLLALARLSQAPLRFRAVDISATACEIVGNLKEVDPSRSVRARIQPGLQVHGDPVLLRIALDNLIGNAWKFTQRVAHAEIELSATTSEHGELVFCLQDNGAGFDMTYAGKLFGSFQRMHLQSEFPGTGLGLASVKRIIARHGGTIWAEGVEGKGAKLFFTLPARAIVRGNEDGAVN